MGAPRRGGLSDQRRITYEAAPGEHVVIKGSEVVTGWEPVGGTVWKADGAQRAVRVVQPVRRGDRRRLDRLRRRRTAPKKHLGDVYLNGLSFYEVTTRPRCRTRRCAPRSLDDWTGARPTGSATPTRRATSGTPRSAPTTTTIWANFQGADPNDRTRRDQRAPLGVLPRPSTTSTTSPCAGSSWPRPPAPGPRRPPTSPA